MTIRDKACIHFGNDCLKSPYPSPDFPHDCLVSACGKNRLREWYGTTLSGNGVRAILEEHWINQDMATCSFFARSKELVRDSGRPV
jgi:hypothetical protein